MKKKEELTEDEILQELLFHGRDILTRPYSGSMMMGLQGDPDQCQAVAEKEGQIVHPDGAVVIDCQGVDLNELVIDGGGKKGALLRAWEGGRPVILKNLEKAQPGSDMGSFYSFMLHLSGEVEEVTFQGKDASDPVVVNRDQFKVPFRVRVVGDER